jgi:two-component system response regulator RegA
MNRPKEIDPVRMKILVVDDDERFRSRLTKALASRGYDACEAGNAETAAALARTHKPGRAIVDLRMPGKSGLEVVSELAALDPEMQIVVLTGYGSIATAVEAVRRGAIEYLTKPVDTEQILAVFDRERDTHHANGSTPAPEPTTPSLARVEWEHIQRILSDCGGNISEAARRLGIHRRSLQRKLGKLPPWE